MKKKIISLLLIFCISFSSINFSYADNVSPRVGAIVVAPEVFTVLMGALASAGIILSTQDSLDFIEKFYLKVDSGVFQYKGIEEFEEDFKNNMKKNNNNDGNKKDFFVLTDSFFSKLKNMLDSTFKDNGNDTVSVSYNPFSEGRLTYITTQSNTLVKGVEMGQKYNTRIIADLLFKPSYDENNYLTFEIDVFETGTSNLVYTSVHKLNSRTNYYVGWSVIDNKATDDNRYNTLYYCYKTPSMPTWSYGSTYSNHIFITSPANTGVSSFTGKYDSSNIQNKFDVIDDLPSNDRIQIGTPTVGVDDEPSEESPNFPKFDFGKLDLKSLSLSFDNFKNKFPFSIPFDIYNFLNILVAEPKAPIFEISFLTQTLKLDFSMFDKVANIIRAFSVFSFVFVLFRFTKKFGE